MSVNTPTVAEQVAATDVTPRMTDKQIKAAQAKAATKGAAKPPKHKPSAAQIAANNAAAAKKDGKRLNARQEADLKLVTGDGQVVEVAPDTTLYVASKKGRRQADPVEIHEVILTPAAVPQAKQEPESPVVKVAPALPNAPYHGPMLSLRQRLKQGAYAKMPNGQPACGDQVATILGQLSPQEVIEACLIAINITNPYTHLNIGQQSMNLRNKLRGMLKRGDIGMGVLTEAVEEVLEKRIPDVQPEAPEAD